MPNHILSVPDLIDEAGGPAAFGRICGFKKNPGPRGSDMKTRNNIPVRYWPAILNWAKGADRAWRYHTLVQAHIGKTLPLDC